MYCGNYFSIFSARFFWLSFGGCIFIGNKIHDKIITMSFEYKETGQDKTGEEDEETDFDKLKNIVIRKYGKAPLIENLANILIIYHDRYKSGLYDKFPMCKKRMAEMLKKVKYFMIDLPGDEISSMPFNQLSKKQVLDNLNNPEKYLKELSGDFDNADEMFQLLKRECIINMDKKGNVFKIGVFDPEFMGDIISDYITGKSHVVPESYMAFANVAGFKELYSNDYMGYEICFMIPYLYELHKRGIITTEGAGLNFTSFNWPNIRGLFPVSCISNIYKIPYVSVEMMDLNRVVSEKEFDQMIESDEIEIYLSELTIDKYLDIMVSVKSDDEYADKYVSKGKDPFFEDLIAACSN